MSEQKIQCVAPDCRVCGPSKHMWVPERKARERANGGKRISSADLVKFALCGKHQSLLRKQAKGVKIYRLSEEIAREAGFERRQRESEQRFDTFASLFTDGGKGNGQSDQTEPA